MNRVGDKTECTNIYGNPTLYKISIYIYICVCVCVCVCFLIKLANKYLIASHYGVVIRSLLDRI